MVDETKKRVLICDDDPGILEVIKIILESNGYEVKSLSNGKSIQKIIKEYNPGVLLLDIWMPGIDGKEITKILKRDPETKNLPVIVVTALNQPDKIATDVGADDFLVKPFDMNDLLLKVEKYMQ